MVTMLGYLQSVIFGQQAYEGFTMFVVDMEIISGLDPKPVVVIQADKNFNFKVLAAEV